MGAATGAATGAAAGLGGAEVGTRGWGALPQSMTHWPVVPTGPQVRAQ